MDDNYYRTQYRAEQRARWELEKELRTTERWMYLLGIIVVVLTVAVIKLI